MPSSSSQRRATARRALIADISTDRKGWLRHGIAALGVSLLGLGVAASVALTGAAQAREHPASVVKAAKSAVAAETTAQPHGSTPRGPGGRHGLKSLADQRAEELTRSEDDDRRQHHVGRRARQVAEGPGGRGPARPRRLGRAGNLPATRPRLPSSTPAPSRATGRACPPVPSYRISARFGQVGIWSRYHTGFDFSAPIGTAIRAPSPPAW